MGTFVFSAFGFATMPALSGTMLALYGFVLMMATVQVFGTDVLEALDKYKSGKNTVSVSENQKLVVEESNSHTQKEE